MDLRNIAIIAHVDHGKTTLVDNLLKQSGAVAGHQAMDERAMDSNDLEKERGITILAKCTSVEWKGIRLNTIDTPGHADFGGEVERILSMVDGVVLLVDSAEGPMPQTKFVLGKALGLGLKPMVVINKIDRPDARPEWVHDAVFDLFVALEASDEQLDFPMVYASGRDGWAVADLNDPRESLEPLFDLIVDHVPAPTVDAEAPFSMLATTLEADNFLGRILTGRIETGSLKMNDPIKVLDREGKVVEQGRATKLLSFRGLERVPVDEAHAGDIIALAGLVDGTVSHTICAKDVNEPLSAQPIDPPTLSMTFAVNDSPLAGREGSKVTSRQIGARLEREAEGNVALQITESTDKDSFDVAGRGELQLGVLIETMRREGFELSISRPQVVFQYDENVRKLEPIEEVMVDVDEDYSGTVVEKITLRKGELLDMRPSGGGKMRLTFLAPARGLIGYYGEFLTDTRGTGIMNRVFHSYGEFRGAVEGRRNGVLISNGDGEANAYALNGLEERGILFIGNGDKVYEGMIVGENSRENDLEVNVLKAKQLTNIRAAGKDDAIKLTPPKRRNVEEAIAWISDDELVEVTPENIRLRKKFLKEHERRKAKKGG